MTPKELGYCIKGERIKQKIKDEEMWRMGIYVQAAVSVAVEHNLAGRKAKLQYFKEPFLSKAEITEKKITEKDIQMAILTEKKYMAMAVNRGLPETIIK